MEPKWHQNLPQNVEKNEYEKQGISRQRFSSVLNDFWAILGVILVYALAFFPKLCKKADMRFDCAMASGLRVGPLEIEPTILKNLVQVSSKRDPQKKWKKINVWSILDSQNESKMLQFGIFVWTKQNMCYVCWTER